MKLTLPLRGRVPFALPAVLFLCGAGCGGADNVARVHGRVTLDGKPLPDANVEFKPQAPPGRASIGRTDANGEYTLAYTPGVEGAQIGTHAVRVWTGGDYEDASGQVKTAKEVVPEKYHAASKLTKDVAAGANTIDLELATK